MTDIEAGKPDMLAKEACQLLASAVDALEVAGLTTAAAIASVALDDALACISDLVEQDCPG